MKKHHITLIIISALLLSAISFSLVFSSGIVRREKDGLTQLSCIYLKDVYVENGTLSYTLTNFSLREFGGLSRIFFEKKINDEWVNTNSLVSDKSEQEFLGTQGNSLYQTEKRFASVTRSVPLSPECSTPGEYRFYHSYTARGIRADRLYVVGYYTIPE